MCCFFNYVQRSHDKLVVTTVFGSDLFLCVIVIATLGGAAIFTEALKSISLCNEVLPLCFTLVTKSDYCFVSSRLGLQC